jgi:hypothetical protein
LVNDFGKY